MFGPQLELAERIHAEKYRGEGETFREGMNRVANALRDDEHHFRAFREVLLNQRFLPGGRVQAAMGSTKGVTPYNCFVSGTIEDSFVHGHGCIMDRATEAATTMRMGGGIGYDFSTLRPRGASIKKLASRSSGPVSFMTIFDSVGRCIASAGHRRGAQMAVLRVDHPDVEEFIHAKQNKGALEGFNVSLAVTDRFMECLRDDKPFPLTWGGELYKEVNPRTLWSTIMRSTWDWAEPGVLFIDTINRENNLQYCETIAATNPCGEQPLPPYGACLLGSFNLTKYVVSKGQHWVFDMVSFHKDIPHVVRAMDNVVDRATYPLHEQEREAQSKRRIGLGVTGAANVGEALGYPYGSPTFCRWLDGVMTTLRNGAYRASADLAVEKGAFPLLRGEYGHSPFIQRLPRDLVEQIQRTGTRNSHLISIAPTGTISLTADNVSSGIEPVFAHVLERNVLLDSGPTVERIQDYGLRVFGVRGRTTAQVTGGEHLDVLKACVPYVDSAISKTCNVPSDMPWEDFQQLYVRAWEAGAKGLTTYQMGGQREGILTDVSCDLNPDGSKNCE